MMRLVPASTSPPACKTVSERWTTAQPRSGFAATPASGSGYIVLCSSRPPPRHRADAGTRTRRHLRALAGDVVRLAAGEMDYGELGARRPVHAPAGAPAASVEVRCEVLPRLVSRGKKRIPNANERAAFN